MKFKKLHYLSSILAAGLFVLSMTSFSGGIPGMSTGGCNCHAPTPSGATAIDITGRPAGGYVNGQTYSLSLTVTNITQVAAGFSMTVNTGTFSTVGTGTTTLSSQEMAHTSPKMMVGGTTTWAFNWTAPSSGSTPATFSIAGNAVNLNATNDIGDIWNLNTVTIAAATAGPSAPTVIVGTPTGITTNAATINATVNANNASTTATIQYGTTVAYGNSISAVPGTITGSSATNITGAISGLAASTTYHYRVVAVNSAGTSNSPDHTFTTVGLPGVPIVFLGAVTNITNNQGVVNATVNANNSNTTVTVEYGTTAAYGNTRNASPAQVTGTTTVATSATLNLLLANTTYHYRFVASNSSGTTRTNDATFKTTNNNVSVTNIGQDEFRLFPNPGKNQVLLTGKNPTAIEARGIDGKRFGLSYRFVGNDQYEIAIASLPPGIYIVNIISEGHSYSTRFHKL